MRDYENLENKNHSLEEYLEIKPYRPLVYITQVELHPLPEIDRVPAVHLPETGYARPHAQAAPLPGLVLADLARQRRPGTHKAHASYQDIKQLRQLVYAEAPDETAIGAAVDVSLKSQG